MRLVLTQSVGLEHSRYHGKLFPRAFESRDATQVSPLLISARSLLFKISVHSDGIIAFRLQRSMVVPFASAVRYVYQPRRPDPKIVVVKC